MRCGDISPTDLTSQLLTRRGATEQAKAITAIISQCEEAQYSPIESATMTEIYGRGIEIVSKIESIVKK